MFYVGYTEKNGKGVFAAKPVAKGRPILRLTGWIKERSEILLPAYSLQVGEDLFLDGEKSDHMNHSCSPSCRINFNTLEVAAIRDIWKGEELTFDYNTTEYDMVRNGDAFMCNCGSKECVGFVKGFKYLGFERKKKLQGILSPFLRKKMEEELSIKVG